MPALLFVFCHLSFSETLPPSTPMKQLIVILFLLTTAWPLVNGGQKKLKPWNEWSKKDAETILNDSGWGQTQVETDTSELFFRPQGAPNTLTGPGNTDPNRDERGGATNQATSVKYRIRFLSAKPIRQAVARLIELEQPTSNNQVRAFMKDFVERRFDRWIAVTVSFESSDQRYLAQAAQAFNSAVAEVLKNNTFLERKDGKRLFLHTYQAPTQDGLGAKFIFTRTFVGRPFLNDESGEVRFVSEVSKNIKLDRRFRVAEMMFDGQLEY